MSDFQDKLKINELTISKRPYGTLNNATVLTVDGYNWSNAGLPAGQAAVNGISGSALASYEANDVVGEFVRMGATKIENDVIVDAISFTSNSVVFKTLPKELKENSVLFAVKDTWSTIADEKEKNLQKHRQIYGGEIDGAANVNADRYQAVVTSIDKETNTAYVEKWVKYKSGSNVAVAPDSSYNKIVIDGIKKAWLWNGILSSFGEKSGVVAEIDLYGSSVKKQGYDVILKNGGLQYGFRVRRAGWGENPSNLQYVKKAYIDERSDYSFYSVSPEKAALYCEISSLIGHKATREGDKIVSWGTDNTPSNNNTLIIDTYHNNLKLHGYSVNALGIVSTGGSEIEKLTSSISSGEIPKKMYITNASNVTLTLSKPAGGDGIETSILVLHDDFKLQGKLRYSKTTTWSDGFSAVPSASVTKTFKKGQKIDCVFYDGCWFLTRSVAAS